MNLNKILMVALALVSGNAAQGQTTLLGWEFTGVAESAVSVTATTVGSNIGTSAPSGILSRGSGAAAPGSPSSSAFGASGFTATDLSGALAASDYFTFSVTINSGSSMTLTSVVMRLFDTTSGPTNAALFSSVGGFTQSSAAIQTFALTGNANNDQSITLSSGSFSNLTGTVEFRLYAYGGSGGSTDKLRFRNLSGNDLVLNGTVSVAAVPEPSTYAALCGAIALLAAIYRRRKA
jgi:hypothetical protein